MKKNANSGLRKDIKIINARTNMVHDEDNLPTCQNLQLKKNSSLESPQVRKKGISKNFLYHWEEIDEEVFEKNKKPKVMKNLITRNKIKNIVNNFKDKIKRVNIYYPPIEGEMQVVQNKENQLEWCELKGCPIMKKINILVNLLYVIQFVFGFLFYGVGIVFYRELEELNQFSIFQYSSLSILLIQIFQGIFCQKISSDRKLVKVKQIFFHYVRNNFSIDALCLLVLIIDLNIEEPLMRYLRLCFFLKIRYFFRKVAQLQIFFINNFEREQYWGVIKVFVINFLMAHIIAVIYLKMGEEQNNWMISMGINSFVWIDQYAYSYFWAMSTMLGFGNAIPANAREAILISIVECFSCIMLAYIINHVGTLLTNIAKKNEDKEKDLQTSRRLADENNVSEQLLSKINNYIRQTDSIEKKFNYKADSKFLMNLPRSLKDQFFKESNQKTFQNLFLFNTFSEKSVIKLAEIIKIKIAHPLETIFSHKENFKFMILKKGEVGYFSKMYQSSHVPYNKILIKKNSLPEIIDLSVFVPQKKDDFLLIKAEDFSILYELQIEEIRDTLGGLNVDYLNFCKLRDKSKHIIDEFQVLECPYCKTKHSKLTCPRLHYTPYKSMIIYKYLKQEKQGMNIRQNKIRLAKQPNYPLKLYKQVYGEIQIAVYYQRVNTKQSKDSCSDEPYQNQNIIQQSFFSRTEIQMSKINTVEKRNSKQNDRKQRNHKMTAPESTKMKRMLEDYLRKRSMVYEKNKDFWDLEIDELTNFRCYFPKSNPSYLIDLMLPSSDKNAPKKKKKFLPRYKTGG